MRAAAEDEDVFVGTGVVARVDVAVEMVVDAVVELEDLLEENDGASFSLIVLEVENVDEMDTVCGHLADET